MQLQRTIGNRAVGRLLSSIGNSSPAQPTVQRQEIPEEEEPLQGKMAETVQRQEIPEEEEPLQGKMIGTVQRQEIPEEDESLQGKFEDKPEIACPFCFAAPIVQKQEIPEEEEPLQGKMIETVQRQEIPEEEEPLQGKMKPLNCTPFIQGKFDTVRSIENDGNMKEPLQMTRGKSRKQVRDRKKLERKHINERFQGSRRKGLAENTNTSIANGIIRRKSHNFTTRSGGGAFLIGGVLHGYDESKMPWAGKEQIETWPFLNCAEAKMYLHIIELGGSPPMFEITSLDEQGKIHSPCRNCRQWVYDVFGKVNPPRDKIERYLHPDEQ